MTLHEIEPRVLVEVGSLRCAPPRRRQQRSKPPLTVTNGHAFWRGVFIRPDTLRKLRDEFAAETDPMWKHQFAGWPEAIDRALEKIA